MDFQDELDFGMEDIQGSAGSGGTRLSCSQSTTSRISRRGMAGNNNRLRQRPSSIKNSGSNNEDDNHSMGSNTSVVVRGAGTSAWMVQDAGTVQMLKDECSYLCSALLVSKSPHQILTTALELAELLKTRKSRNILWQSCMDATTSTNNEMMAPPNSKTKSVRSSMDVATSSETTSKTNRTILDAILDVVACMATGKSTSKVHTQEMPADTHSTSNSLSGSPSRSVRTKSARRKLKQQQQLQQHLGPHDSQPIEFIWWASPQHSDILPQLWQILALIVYYISLDCTLSKEHSAAAMGAVSKPLLARTVRNIILQHDRALQGLVRLCLLQDHRTRSNGKVPSRDSSGLLSNTNLKRKHCQGTTNGTIDEGDNVSSSIDYSTSPSHKPVDRPMHHHQPVNRAKIVASSPFDDSISSLSQGGESHAPSVTPRARIDPTKLGRLNRRRRRLQGNPFDAKLPAVPENNHLQLDDDDLDWPEGKIVPPPRKRMRDTLLNNGDSVETSLSITSGETRTISTKDSPADPSVQLSPPLDKTPVASRIPMSPDHQSVDSTVMSFDSSTRSQMPAHLVPKLDHLRSQAHLSFSLNDKNSLLHANGCPVSQQTDQWVALVCLDSLNRIISGKEGDGPSCLTEEQKEDEDVSPDDEESNPLLQTNRQLGKSGIIPILAQCMSEELRWGLNLSEEWETCQSCCYHWSQRITILASLIDGACLFNKANRRSFAESFDPFSFDNDLLHNTNTVPQELIFHILWFLVKQTPSPNEIDEKNVPTVLHSSAQRDTIRSGAQLVALRTLTSLTHDNDIAADQMVAPKRFPCESNCNGNDKARNDDLLSLRGIDILAQLVFRLESSHQIKHDQNGKAVVARHASSKREDESNRFDSTIFCLNTLANIIEAWDVRRALTEIQVTRTEGEQELWIEWLCKWIVQKTGNIRDAILSIGKNGGSESGPTLEKDEDDKLVAAGNACVLLACLMTDIGDVSVDPESTGIIRRLILRQMPLDKHGKSTGVALIINTLKAFCNFYHFSLGELSLAIVGPVKKLIDSLSEWKEN